MEILQIVGLGLIASILIVILKQERPEIALQVSIVVGVVIFILMVGRITSVITVIEDMARQSNIDSVYLATILKIIGIAYISEFGAQVCRDAGASAIASKIEFAGKIIIIILAVPIIVALLEIILSLMP